MSNYRKNKWIIEGKLRRSGPAGWGKGQGGLSVTAQLGGGQGGGMGAQAGVLQAEAGPGQEDWAR